MKVAILVGVDATDDAPAYSVNARAEALMGRRLTPEQEERGIVVFDLPCELGYRCPVHNEAWDEDLAWSEYNGFLWCARCDVDYPSCLCVPTVAEPVDEQRDWRRTGIAAAIDIFLDSVEDAVRRRVAESVKQVQDDA